MTAPTEPTETELTVPVQVFIDQTVALLRAQMAIVAGIDERADRVLRYRIIRELRRYGEAGDPLAGDATLLVDTRRLMRSRSAQRDEIDAVMARLAAAIGIPAQTHSETELAA